MRLTILSRAVRSRRGAGPTRPRTVALHHRRRDGASRDDGLRRTADPRRRRRRGGRPVLDRERRQTGPGARARRRHPRRGIPARPRAAAPPRLDRPARTVRHDRDGARRQHAGVPWPVNLLHAGRPQEPQPGLPGKGRRHHLRAHRVRAHARSDREGAVPDRPALRRRERVVTALLVLDNQRVARSWSSRSGNSPSPSASTTSSWTAAAPRTRPRPFTSRTRRSRGASPR